MTRTGADRRMCDACFIERATYRGYCECCSILLIESGALPSRSMDSTDGIQRTGDKSIYKGQDHRPSSYKKLQLPPVPGFKSKIGNYSVLTPCTAQPGSPEKVDVMTERMEAGYHLHHPLDLTMREMVENDRGEYHNPEFGSSGSLGLGGLSVLRGGRGGDRGRRGNVVEE